MMKSSLPHPSRWLAQLRTDLRRSPGKKMVLFGLLPIMLLVWIPLLTKKKKPSPKPSTDSIAESPDQESETTPAFVDYELRSELARYVAQIHAPEEALPNFPSPFARHLGAERTSPGTTKVVSEEEPPARDALQEQEAVKALSLSGTFLSSTRGSVAVIDDRPYRVGDTIGTFVVTEIASRTVALKGQFDTYRVEISSSLGDSK